MTDYEHVRLSVLCVTADAVFPRVPSLTDEAFGPRSILVEYESWLVEFEALMFRMFVHQRDALTCCRLHCRTTTDGFAAAR